MPPESPRHDDASRRSHGAGGPRILLAPGPIVLGVLGWAFCAAFSVTVLTVGLADWLAYALLGIGLFLLMAAIMWGVARASTGERRVRWRGEQ